MEQIAETKQLFNPRDLRRLIIPLVIEQVLAVTVGMADVMMVSSAGEAAVSGVSLVDMINMLIINVFAALATGGAVVVAQLIGSKERERACHAAKQLLFIVGGVSLVITAITLLLRAPLLRLLFGNLADDVMRNALIYFAISAISYPFLAIYNAGAALFRAQGNSRISMVIALMVNCINIVGNAIFIFGMGMGVAGAALASLIARMAAAVVITLLLRRRENAVSLSAGGRFRVDRGLIRRILHIGIPNGLENSMFSLGRVLVVSMIAGFGTTQIAANAVANNIDALGCLPGQALNLAMITVIGQCVGAHDFKQAKYYAKKLMKTTYLFMAVLNIAIIALLPLVLKLYNLSPETMELATILIVIHAVFGMVLWPLSFTLPNVLRAANDVRFTMVVSIFSMWVFRIVLSYVLGVRFGMGAIGVWIAMLVDWFFRSLLFSVRFRNGKWMQHKIG